MDEPAPTVPALADGAGVVAGNADDGPPLSPIERAHELSKAMAVEQEQLQSQLAALQQTLKSFRGQMLAIVKDEKTAASLGPIILDGIIGDLDEEIRGLRFRFEKTQSELNAAKTVAEKISASDAAEPSAIVPDDFDEFSETLTPEQKQFLTLRRKLSDPGDPVMAAALANAGGAGTGAHRGSSSWKLMASLADLRLLKKREQRDKVWKTFKERLQLRESIQRALGSARAAGEPTVYELQKLKQQYMALHARMEQCALRLDLLAAKIAGSWIEAKYMSAGDDGRSCLELVGSIDVSERAELSAHLDRYSDAILELLSKKMSHAHRNGYYLQNNRDAEPVACPPIPQAQQLPSSRASESAILSKGSPVIDAPPRASISVPTLQARAASPTPSSLAQAAAAPLAPVELSPADHCMRMADDVIGDAEMARSNRELREILMAAPAAVSRPFATDTAMASPGSVAFTPNGSSVDIPALSLPAHPSLNGASSGAASPSPTPGTLSASFAPLGAYATPLSHSSPSMSGLRASPSFSGSMMGLQHGSPSMSFSAGLQHASPSMSVSAALPSVRSHASLLNLDRAGLAELQLVLQLGDVLALASKCGLRGSLDCPPPEEPP